MTDIKGLDREPESARIRFGPFELDAGSLELRKAGRPVRLQAQPARLLALLAGRAGDLVTRDEIRQAIWGHGTFVDFEQGINHCVRQLRSALGDDAAAPRYLETIPRLGYRFLGPVERPERTETSPGARDANGPFGRQGAAAEGRPGPRLARRGGLRAAVPLLAAGAMLLGLAAWGRGPQNAGRPVLAVLPFVHMGGGGEAGPGLGDALTEELIGILGSSYGGRLDVIARTSSMAYKATAKDARTIGRELGASHLLEGSVQETTEGIKVTARLLKASTQTPLWSARYEPAAADLAGVQADLAQRIARALAVNLLPAGASSLPAARTRPEVYEAYLRGRTRLASRDVEEAIALFRRCVKEDPSFAPAYAGLASALRAGPPFDRQRGRESRAALEQALALDDGLAEAHVMMAGILFYHDLDSRAARREYERAIRINPAHAAAWHGLAACHSVAGRHEEALEAVRRALALDPLDPMISSDVGWHHYWARRYDDAIRESRRTLAMRPGFHWARRCILFASLMKGDRRSAARQAAEEMREAGEEVPSGDEEPVLDAYWRRELARAGGQAGRGRQSAADLALLRMATGSRSAALDDLEQAYRRRDAWILPFLPVEPLADPLRGDERFERLVAAIAAPR
ncbi:MAG TPA: tetratricopeptide repeat protein [Candidatus Polarisedimenticolia bacterium]|nr:tetratricopeptide repeat protein [Candidatus Polarisedimenticolia bacterium]